MGAVKTTDQAALKIARDFAERVHRLGAGVIVKLFGSAARGELEESSDIDIYVELPDDLGGEAIRSRISDIAWEVGFAHDRVIQAVVYRKSEIWESPLRSSPFIKAVIHEGIPL